MKKKKKLWAHIITGMLHCRFVSWRGSGALRSRWPHTAVECCESIGNNTLLQAVVHSVWTTSSQQWVCMYRYV